MRKPAARSNVSETAARLRAEALAREDGAFLGNEDMLERMLGVSRPTIRQAARVVEREGLLRVRRGNNGGYFCARPDAGFIEATVASYLEVLGARPEDLTRVATALWVETVRQAAGADRAAAAKAVARLAREVARLPADASFSAIQALEDRIRRAVFDLVGGRYVELIFNINANFARRHFTVSPAEGAAEASHRAFVGDWQRSTALLLDAIAAGDAEVAVLAAHRARAQMFERLWPA